MSVKIIVDSTADLTDDIKSQMEVVPLTLRFGEEEYIDGVTIKHREFYEKLIETDVLPTTSQPTPAAFAEVFKKIVDAGDKAVVITISSKLSGTYQSAAIAAEDFPESVYVVDSLNAAIGTGILAELGLKLAKEGKPVEEIAEELTNERENICLIAMVDTLEYLKRGGRISKTVAFAGGLLSIKPVICIKDGEVAIIGKARGSKQANNLLVSEIDNVGGVDFNKPFLLGYTGVSDYLLTKYIEDSETLWKGNAEELRTTPVCSVIGTHAGPGAVAVAFFKKQ